eukprot:Skav211866  [mRNA]  locus=scaffold1431:148752:151141:- [translate_table: standard]
MTTPLRTPQQGWEDDALGKRGPAVWQLGSQGPVPVDPGGLFAGVEWDGSGERFQISAEMVHQMDFGGGRRRGGRRRGGCGRGRRLCRRRRWWWWCW